MTAAAICETLEEVNLRVSLTRILDAYSYPGSQVVVVVYATEVVGGEMKACDECSEVKAFRPESIRGTSWPSRAPGTPSATTSGASTPG